MPASKRDPHKPAANADATGEPEIDAATAADAAGGDEAIDETPAPMNRAERRAKGKAHGTVPTVGKVQPGRINLNHGPRSYANRRSG